jgi:hypothetical protein
MKNYFKYANQNFFEILFLSTRLMIYSCQVPIQTLVAESFSNKERVKNYSNLYLYAKIMTIFIPMALEYLSSNTYDVLIISLAVFVILMTVLCIDETLNKKIRD